MKRIVSILMACCIGLSLCGCQKTPEEVKQRMKSYGKNQQMTSEKITYCSVSDLKKTRLSDIHIKLDNMNLPDQVDFSQIESVEQLNLSFEKDYINNDAKYKKVFQVDPKIKSEAGQDSNGNYLNYNSEGKKQYYIISDNGFMVFAKGASYDIALGNLDQKVLKKYNFSNANTARKAEKFGSKKINVWNICNQAEKWLEKNVSIEQCRYQVLDAFVNEYQNGGKKGQLVTISADVTYKGMVFNPYAASMEYDGASANLNLMAYDVEMAYKDNGQLELFSNGVGNIKINSAQKINQIVDFKSALQIVNTEITGFNKLKIAKIVPMYTLEPQYQNKDEKYGTPGQKIKARPVYAFLIKQDLTQDMKQDLKTPSEEKNNIYNYIFVDMQTGKITTDIENGGK